MNDYNLLPVSFDDKVCDVLDSRIYVL